MNHFHRNKQLARKRRSEARKKAREKGVGIGKPAQLLAEYLGHESGWEGLPSTSTEAAGEFLTEGLPQCSAFLQEQVGGLSRIAHERTAKMDPNLPAPFRVESWPTIQAAWRVSKPPHPLLPMLAALHLKPARCDTRRHATRQIPIHTLRAVMEAQPLRTHAERRAVVLAAALLARIDRNRFGGLWNEAFFSERDLRQAFLPKGTEGKRATEAVKAFLDATSRRPIISSTLPVIWDGKRGDLHRFEFTTLGTDKDGLAVPVNIDSLLALCRRNPLSALVLLAFHLHHFKHFTFHGGVHIHVFDKAGKPIESRLRPPLSMDELLASCGLCHARSRNSITAVKKAIAAIPSDTAQIAESARGWYFQPVYQPDLPAASKGL